LSKQSYRRIVSEEEGTAPSSSSTRIPEHPLLGIYGEDLGRILSLSDGVFAFALTLLALSLAVPTLDTTGLTPGQQSSHLAFLLQQDYNTFIGYAFAFVMIGVWWIVHHRTFQYIARYNSRLVWLNMLVLLQIAVMPFVLRVFSNYADTQVAVDLFAGVQVSLGLTTTLLWDYARRAKLLKKDVPEPVAQFFVRRGLATSAVFALSIGLSFYSVTLAEISWLLTFVVQAELNRRGIELPP